MVSRLEVARPESGLECLSSRDKRCLATDSALFLFESARLKVDFSSIGGLTDAFVTAFSVSKRATSTS